MAGMQSPRDIAATEKRDKIFSFDIYETDLFSELRSSESKWRGIVDYKYISIAVAGKGLRVYFKE